jgi:hypothetical protein
MKGGPECAAAQGPSCLCEHRGSRVGSPDNNQNGCTPHDSVPRLSRVAEPVRFRTLIVMVNSEPALTLVTGTHRKTPCPWWSTAKLESSRETALSNPTRVPSLTSQTRTKLYCCDPSLLILTICPRLVPLYVVKAPPTIVSPSSIHRSLSVSSTLLVWPT